MQKPSVIGNSEKPGDDNRLYDRWVAEAQVLRAILHFDLAQWFGDVPIVGDDENGTPIILDPASTIPGRTPCADVLKWVADECDKYKDNLPFRYSNEEENWGRINGAAAYALSKRVPSCIALLRSTIPTTTRNGGLRLQRLVRISSPEQPAEQSLSSLPHSG